MQIALERSRTLLLCLLWGIAHTGTAAVPDLKYRFQTGSNYVYSVRFEAVEPGGTTLASGNLTYLAKAANQDNATLTVRGSLSAHPKARADGKPTITRGAPDTSLRIGGLRFWDLGAVGGPFGEANEVRIDAKGRDLRDGVGPRLPHGFGALPWLMLETLPPLGVSSFTVTNDCTVLAEEREPLTPTTFRFKQVRLPARETASYTVGTNVGGIVSVRKAYELTTLASTGGQPRFQFKGEGTNTFDVKAGLFRELTLTGTLTNHGGNAPLRVPVTLSVKLLAGGTSATEPRPPVLLTAQRSKPLSAEERAALLADLKSWDKGRRNAALQKLSQSPPDTGRLEVEAGLLGLLESDDAATRIGAARVLGIWGGKASVEPLLKRLPDPMLPARWAAMEALGRLGDGRAAEPLARLLADRKNLPHASNALKALGPDAEDTVLKLLEEGKPEQRREACEVLKVIATRKSTAALEKAASDPDGLVARFAKEALKTAKGGD